MNITHVVCSYPPYHGGIGNVARELATRTRQAGHTVMVLTPAQDGRTVEEDDQGVRVVRVSSAVRFGNAAFSPWLLRWLQSTDIIHLHLPFIGGAEVIWWGFVRHRLTSSRGQRPRLVLHYHMDLIGRGLKAVIFSLTQRWFYPHLFAKADHFLVTSSDYWKSSRVAKIFPSNKVSISEFPNGVDTSIFLPTATPNETLRARWNIAPEQRVLLFVSTLDAAHYFKGLEILLRAFPVVQTSFVGLISPHLVIIGGGALLEYYEQRALEMGENRSITFTGSLSRDELVQWYQQAAVCVVPSIDRSEAFSLVALEAMASGVPVVASALPGVRSVVRDGQTGTLVPGGDQTRLAQAIVDILRDDTVQKNMAAAARLAAVQEYDWSIRISQICTLYETLESQPSV